MLKKYGQTPHITAQLLLLLYSCYLRLKTCKCNLINSGHLIPIPPFLNAHILVNEDTLQSSKTHGRALRANSWYYNFSSERGWSKREGKREGIREGETERKRKQKRGQSLLSVPSHPKYLGQCWASAQVPLQVWTSQTIGPTWQKPEPEGRGLEQVLLEFWSQSLFPPPPTNTISNRGVNSLGKQSSQLEPGQRNTMNLSHISHCS